MFGGEGQPDIDFGDYLTILSGKNLSADEDTSNQICRARFENPTSFFSGMLRYTLKPAVRIEAGGFPMLNAWIVGLLPAKKIEPSGRLSLRLEIANLATDSLSWRDPGMPIASISRDYTHETLIMGHHVGSAAIDHFAEFELRFAAVHYLNNQYRLRN